jgi:hypothetical protein
MTEPTGNPSKPGIPKNFNTIKTDDKADEDFRIYSEDTSLKRVVEHYRDMRRFQTVDFYRRMEQKYSFENGNFRKRMTMEEAFTELEDYVVGFSRMAHVGVIDLVTK